MYWKTYANYSSFVRFTNEMLNNYCFASKWILGKNWVNSQALSKSSYDNFALLLAWCVLKWLCWCAGLGDFAQIPGHLLNMGKSPSTFLKSIISLQMLQENSAQGRWDPLESSSFCLVNKRSWNFGHICSPGGSPLLREIKEKFSLSLEIALSNFYFHILRGLSGVRAS